MITWNNLDKLTSYQELEKTESVDLAAVMAGENRACEELQRSDGRRISIQLCSEESG